VRTRTRKAVMMTGILWLVGVVFYLTIGVAVSLFLHHVFGIGGLAQFAELAEIYLRSWTNFCAGFLFCLVWRSW